MESDLVLKANNLMEAIDYMDQCKQFLDKNVEENDEYDFGNRVRQEIRKGQNGDKESSSPPSHQV
jgi:L-fucose isomerase-like protein